MRAERVISLTTASGERIAVSQERHPRRSYGRMFHTTFDEAAASLASRITNGPAVRLFLILPRHLSYTTFRRLDREKAAGELNTDGSTISRAMAILHAAGAVERKGRGPYTEWRLSSDYGWRGDVDSWHAEQRAKGQDSPTSPPSGGQSKVVEGISGKPSAGLQEAGTKEAGQPSTRQTRLRLLTPLKSPPPPAPGA